MCLVQELIQLLADNPKTMTKTLQITLAPLFITGSYCCLCMFEYPLGQPRLYVSCLYAFVILSYFIYEFFSMFLIVWQNNKISLMDIQICIFIPLVLISFYRFKVKILTYLPSVSNITLSSNIYISYFYLAVFLP